MHNLNFDEMTDSRELMETKEPPVLRWFFCLILIVMMLVAVALSVFEIDTHISATGTVQPLEETISVSSVASGLIKAVLVQDGDDVEQGQALFELDSEYAEQQKEIIEKDLSRIEQTRQSLELYQQSVDRGENLLTEDDALRASYLEYEARLASARAQHERQLSSLSSSANQSATTKAALSEQLDYYSVKGEEYTRAIEAAEIGAEYTGGDESLSAGFAAYKSQLSQLEFATSQARSALSLAEESYGSGAISSADLEAARKAVEVAELSEQSTTINYLKELRMSLDQVQQQVSSVKSQIAQIGVPENISSETLESALSQIKLQELAQIETKIQEIDSSKSALSTQMLEITRNLEEAVILSPSDGTVLFHDQLASGTIVQSGNPVLSIVPGSDQLSIVFGVAENDIAQVKVGDKILCSINSLPFQEFGKIEGIVQSISATSFIDDQTGARFYRAEGLLDGTSLVKDDGSLGVIKPGMMARVDVIGGTEKLASWVLRELNFVD